MDFNPFSSQYTAVRNRIVELSEQAERIESALLWYANIDLAAIHEELRHSKANATKLENDIAALESEIIVNESELTETASSVGSFFNPGNWFAKTQVALRRRCKELRDAKNQKDASKQSKINSLKSVHEKMEHFFSVVLRHDAFDSNREAANLQEIRQRLGDTKNELEDIALHKRQVDYRLGPLIDQLNDLKSQKESADLKLRQARDFDQRISNASNSYERAMIHKECESRFRNGSPRIVIREQETIITRVDRAYEKTNRRAEEVGRKAARVIKTLVIDGNNLCYEGDRFIGLSAIEALLPKLSDYSIVIVFDSAIRPMLQVDDSSLRKRLNRYATVHVVASGELADETILDLASADPKTYVLSNDRFGDFNEKKVVRDGRIIPHEIVSGHVFVHELDVSALYQ